MMPTVNRVILAAVSATAICQAVLADGAYTAQPARRTVPTSSDVRATATQYTARPAAAQATAPQYTARPAAAQAAAPQYTARPAAAQAAAPQYNARPAAAQYATRPAATQYATTQPATRMTRTPAAATSSFAWPSVQMPEDFFGHWLEDPDEVGWIAGRLELGWRIARAKADKKHSWHEAQDGMDEYGFLGSMEYLNETENYHLFNLVASYKLCDWFAIGASWDRISEVATTRSEDNHQDGEWSEKGPSLSAILTTPRILDTVSPYLELGVHFPSASFDPYSWWTLGYPSPAYYESIGSPSTSNKGYERIITAKESDAMTFLWGVGLKVYVLENLALDIAYRHIDCDIDAHYRRTVKHRTIEDRGMFKIPLSYSQLCFGVRWAF